MQFFPENFSSEPASAESDPSFKLWVIAAALFLLARAAVAAVPAPPAATLQSIEQRAAQFDRQFYPSGAPTQYLDPVITPGVSKIRELRTVLPGALYRGGGPGGMKPLPPEALQSLCEAGFSLAIYGYTDGYKPSAPVTCTVRATGRPNSLDYISVEASDLAAKKVALARIQKIILNPALGPALVHCWNGYHASGELAAVSLLQFCSSRWTGATASAYWLRHANGAAMISRIGKFSPFPELVMSDEVQAELCKQTR